MRQRQIDLTIDRALPSDCAAVVALLAAQMSEHRMPVVKTRLSQTFDQILADDQYGFLLVAKLNGKIVAVAYVATILSIEHGSRVGWLEELYVWPEYRNGGIGSALLRSAVSISRKEGLSALDLEVDVEHRRAESLYERFGFRRLPRSRWVKELLASRGKTKGVRV